MHVAQSGILALGTSSQSYLDSCFLRLRLRVGKSTPDLLVLAWDISASPCTPSSTHRFRMA